MPGGDRTGPLGLGPATGRAFGYCYGYDSPGFTKWPGSGMGRGFGRGFGRGSGRGVRRGYLASTYFSGNIPAFHWPHSISREDEIKLLKARAEELKRSQKEVEKRLGELENED